MLQSSSVPDLTIDGSSKSDAKNINARVKNSQELGDTVDDDLMGEYRSSNQTIGQNGFF